MFRVTGETSWDTLAEQIRGIGLFDQPKIKPYAQANVEVTDLRFDEVQPTSRYVIRSNLELMARLAIDLNSQGIDLLAMDYGVWVDDGEREEGLIPPIVELRPGQTPYILDGTHRSYNARRAGRTTFRAIVISDIDPSWPAGVFPVEWSEILEYDKLPADPALKRKYRPGHLEYRTDFGALNGSRFRG